MGPLLSTRRGRLAAVLLVVALATAATLVRTDADAGAGTRCERFTAASTSRLAADTGPTGAAAGRTVVIGDSWSVGLGLERPGASWPARLPGRVHVAGFSGSGFSAGSSGCGPQVSYAARAPVALQDGADLVVLEGGLNDVDQSDAAITAGFERLLQRLEGHRVVVVGPAAAPARAGRVPRVDALLADLAARHDVPYVATSDLVLPYLSDRLHLTAEGHRRFGDAVARRIAALP